MNKKTSKKSKSVGNGVHKKGKQKGGIKPTVCGSMVAG